jgi:hypothetical protein
MPRNHSLGPTPGVSKEAAEICVRNGYVEVVADGIRKYVHLMAQTGEWNIHDRSLEASKSSIVEDVRDFGLVEVIEGNGWEWRRIIRRQDIAQGNEPNLPAQISI